MLGTAEHCDGLDQVSVVTERRAYAIAKGLLVLFVRDDYGDITSGRWQRGYMLPRFQGQHLLGYPRVGGSQIADVRDRLAQHERPFEPHPERQSRPLLGVEP